MSILVQPGGYACLWASRISVAMEGGALGVQVPPPSTTLLYITNTLHEQEDS